MDCFVRIAFLNNLLPEDIIRKCLNSSSVSFLKTSLTVKRREEDYERHNVVNDANNIGEEGELDSLGVGREMEEEEDKDEEQGVQVEVECLPQEK